MKLAIEGMDGVGKSTIARELAKKENLFYIDKPLHYFFEDNEENNYADLMKMANKVYDIKDPVIRSWFIGLGNIFCFRNFKNEDFIIDRHFVSNYFWNGESDSDEVFNSMINIVGKPDLTIILYATPQTRMKRLMKRNPNDKDIIDPEKQADGYDKMIYFVEKFNIPYLLINTEEKTIEEIVNEISIKIDKLRSNLDSNKTYQKKLIK